MKTLKSSLDKSTIFYKTLNNLLDEIQHYNENEIVLKGNGIYSSTKMSVYKIPSNTDVKDLKEFKIK